MDEDKIKTWIHNNSGMVSKIASLMFLVTGLLVVIGAIKNWDWIYEPDDSYHNWWNTGQISRYLGRNTARVVGTIGGFVLISRAFIGLTGLSPGIDELLCCRILLIYD